MTGSDIDVSANKAIVHRLYDEYFNEGRTEIVQEIISANYISHNRPGERGLGVFEQTSETLIAALEEIHFDVQDLFAEGDRIAVRYLLTGRQIGPLFGTPPTNERIEQHTLTILRIQDGKIAESWVALEARSIRRFVQARQRIDERPDLPHN
jgi:predicted ester cyclase